MIASFNTTKLNQLVQKPNGKTWAVYSWARYSTKRCSVNPAFWGQHRKVCSENTHCNIYVLNVSQNGKEKTKATAGTYVLVSWHNCLIMIFNFSRFTIEGSKRRSNVGKECYEKRKIHTNKQKDGEGGREAGREAGRKQGKEARKKVTYSWTVGRQSLGSYLPHRWKFQSNPCKDNNMNSTLMFAATTLFRLSLLTPCQTTHRPTHLPTYLQSACLSAYLPTNLYICQVGRQVCLPACYLPNYHIHARLFFTCH